MKRKDSRMEPRLYSILSGFFIILCLINLGGCAKKDAIKQISDEDALRERVQAYWAHNIKEEYDKSYEFEYPLFKKNVSMVEYLRNITNNVRWERVEILKIEMGDGNADVTVMMDVNVKGLPIRVKGRDGIEFKGNARTEKWIKTDGLWYHVPKKFRGDR